jgi:dual specificity tyrosine-phosphorylation-regulated kinase 2/3/4
MSWVIYWSYPMPSTQPSPRHLKVSGRITNDVIIHLSLSEILSTKSSAISEYEMNEILEYPSIYYFGANRQKRHATSSSSSNNHGYDDERGDYLAVIGEHLAYRYEVMDTLGKGSFGQVLRCKDHQTGESVAIKIIRNKKRFHHQALVEVKILNNLREWVCFHLR